MDFYMVVEIDEEDASWLGDPATFDTKHEAFDYKKDQDKLNPDLFFAVYRCEEVYERR